MRLYDGTNVEAGADSGGLSADLRTDFCVYKTLIGRYEDFNDVQFPNTAGIRHICLTDDPDLVSAHWEIRRITPLFPYDEIRSQRALKVLAHRYLPEFRWSLYVDNTVQITRDVSAIFADNWRKSAFTIPSHSFRDTVVDEFLEVARLGYDDGSRIFEQLNHYALTHEALLSDKPLWTAIMLREHHDPLLQQAMETWWAHIARYSRRDQLSINYALAVTGLRPNVLDLDNHRSDLHSWPHAPGRDRAAGARNPSVSMRPVIAQVRVLEQQLVEAQTTIAELRGARHAQTQADSLTVQASARVPGEEAEPRLQHAFAQALQLAQMSPQFCAVGTLPSADVAHAVPPGRADVLSRKLSAFAGRYPVAAEGAWRAMRAAWRGMRLARDVTGRRALPVAAPALPSVDGPQPPPTRNEAHAAAWQALFRAAPAAPRTFGERVLRKMAYDRNPILKVFADKIAVRDYVASTVGAEYLADIYAVAERAEDIPWQALPREYVCKVNHGSGGVVVVWEGAKRDPLPDGHTPVGWTRCWTHPDTADRAAIERLAAHWLALDFDWWEGRYPEWAYEGIPRRVFCEQLHKCADGSAPSEYRFFVFNGVVRVIRVAAQTLDGDITRITFDRDWNVLPVSLIVGELRPPPAVPPPRPANFEQLLAHVEALAAPVDFVRVDMYNVDGRFYFGELTNYPSAGRGVWRPEPFEQLLAAWWRQDY